MANYHRRGEAGDARARIESMKDMMHVSKDINDWRFERRTPPDGAAPSMVYLYVGIDKTTGAEAYWPMDRVDADEHGNFESEEKRTREEFATSLQQLDAAIRLARLKQEMQQTRLALPRQATAAQAARILLQKGDHLN